MERERGQVELQLHAFNQWVYCDYRFWLMYACGEMVKNHYVYRGLRAHRRVDRVVEVLGESERSARSVHVRHQGLGLVGVVDLLERDPMQGLIPVETKAGRLKGQEPWANDVLQIAAQALCVEDTYGEKVRYGMIYYAGSRRRVLVELGESVKAEVGEAAADMRRILGGERHPKAVYGRKCEGCSLYELCLPRAAEQFDKISGADTGDEG
jgi:CRISPR-associated exonuclease Cas4